MSNRGGGFVTVAGLTLSTVAVLVAAIVAYEDGQLTSFGKRFSNFFKPDEPVAPITPTVGSIIEIVRNGSGEFCGQSYRVTFKIIGSELGNGVFLHGGDKTVSLNQHEVAEITPGCRVTFENFIERSTKFAQFTVSE